MVSLTAWAKPRRTPSSLLAADAVTERELIERTLARLEKLTGGEPEDQPTTLAELATRVEDALQALEGGGAAAVDLSGVGDLASVVAAVAELRQISAEQSDFLQEASRAADRMQGSIVENSRLAQSAAEVATELGTLTDKRTAEIESVVSRLQTRAEQAGESLSHVFDVSDSSGEIARMAGAIDGIAQQTKILALNAAVSAARAGDNGLEFAVISREIRRLATSAAETAGDITRVIGDFETKTKGAADAMQQIDVGLEDVDHAGVSLHGIASDTGRLIAAVDQISDHSRAQSAATSDVLFGIDAAVLTGEQLVESLQRVADFINSLRGSTGQQAAGAAATTEGE